MADEKIMEGIVTETIGGFFYVADNNREIHQCRIRGKVQETIYPGDKVRIEDKMIEELIERENLLPRPKVANVSAVNIMFSVNQPEINFNMIDRFLLLIEREGFNPVIFINKLDLEPNFAEEKNKKLAAYEKAGYSIFIFSVKEQTNLRQVEKSLQRGINVMAGPSGVGKTALINKLVPEADLELGDISEKLGRGTHTTRQVKLLPLKKGGWVADTPGFTSLSLENLFPEEVKLCFPEFAEYRNSCHFSSCSHTHEPDCAVKKAVAAGEIAEFRYESYCELLEIVQEKGGPDYG